LTRRKAGGRRFLRGRALAATFSVDVAVFPDDAGTLTRAAPARRFGTSSRESERAQLRHAMAER